MNPMAKARGLQLARNDNAAAYGCMTAARQNRSSAACASSDAWMRNRGVHPSVDVGHFTLATLPARNPPHVQFSRCSAAITVRSAEAECLEQTDSVPQKGDGAYPMPEGRGLRAGER